MNPIGVLMPELGYDFDALEPATQGRCDSGGLVQSPRWRKLFLAHLKDSGHKRGFRLKDYNVLARN